MGGKDFDRDSAIQALQTCGMRFKCTQRSLPVSKEKLADSHTTTWWHHQRVSFRLKGFADTFDLIVFWRERISGRIVGHSEAEPSLRC